MLLFLRCSVCVPSERQNGATTMEVRYLVNGVEVTSQEFRSRGRNGMDFSGPPNICTEWKEHWCEASAVHPSLREEAVAFSKRHGVPTEFDVEGRPKHTSARHQAKHLELMGLYNKDGVLGNPLDIGGEYRR